TTPTNSLHDALPILKKQMVKLSVPEDKIHVVLHGATVPVSLPETPRSVIMFYAGHKVMTNKGIQTLFQAMAIIQKRMGEKTPTRSEEHTSELQSPDQ